MIFDICEWTDRRYGYPVSFAANHQCLLFLVVMSVTFNMLMHVDLFIAGYSVMCV